MQYRQLGTTGIQVSAVSFGAGPIAALMTGEDDKRQRAVINHAIARGINWFDTAPTYGHSTSERNLGRALKDLDAAARVHVATKVRFTTEDLADIPGAARRSLCASLERLHVSRVTLLQLHNSITRRRDDEPTSVTPADVLGPGGIAEAFQRLRDEGLVEHLGLTAIGHAPAVREVVQSGIFSAVQVPYNLLNAMAGGATSDDAAETDYGNIIGVCHQRGIGVLAIRVLAGGALADNPPSLHTRKTPFFPLALYEQDRSRARRLREAIGPERRLPVEAIRFALAHPGVSSTIIGFAEPREIDEALVALEPDRAPVDWNVR